MMKAAKVADNVYTRNVVIVVLGMGYSVFALYASGKDAVMGGMLVLGVVYIVWGFIANRFTGQLEGSSAARGEGLRRTIMRIKSSALFAARLRRARLCDAGRRRQTLDRIKETAFIKLGYLTTHGHSRSRVRRASPTATRSSCASASSKQLKKDLALAAVELTVRAGGHGLAHVRARQRAHRPAVFAEQCHAGQTQGSVVLDSGVRRGHSRGHADRRRMPSCAPRSKRTRRRSRQHPCGAVRRPREC